MTLRDRISLTLRYGRAQLLIGAVYNLVCMNYLLSEISYTFFVDCFIIKVVVTSITLYLVSRFRGHPVNICPYLPWISIGS